MEIPSFFSACSKNEEESIFCVYDGPWIYMLLATRKGKHLSL